MACVRCVFAGASYGISVITLIGLFHVLQLANTGAKRSQMPPRVVAWKKWRFTAIILLTLFLVCFFVSVSSGSARLIQMGQSKWNHSCSVANRARIAISNRTVQIALVYMQCLTVAVFHWLHLDALYLASV